MKNNFQWPGQFDIKTAGVHAALAGAAGPDCGGDDAPAVRDTVANGGPVVCRSGWPLCVHWLRAGPAAVPGADGPHLPHLPQLRGFS